MSVVPYGIRMAVNTELNVNLILHFVPTSGIADPICCSRTNDFLHRKLSPIQINPAANETLC